MRFQIAFATLALLVSVASASSEDHDKDYMQALFEDLDKEAASSLAENLAKVGDLRQEFKGSLLHVQEEEALSVLQTVLDTLLQHVPRECRDALAMHAVAGHVRHKVSILLSRTMEETPTKLVTPKQLQELAGLESEKLKALLEIKEAVGQKMIRLMSILGGDAHFEILLRKLPALVEKDVLMDRTFGELIQGIAKVTYRALEPFTDASTAKCSIKIESQSKYLDPLESYLSDGFKKTLKNLNLPTELQLKLKERLQHGFDLITDEMQQLMTEFERGEGIPCFLKLFMGTAKRMATNIKVIRAVSDSGAEDRIMDLAEPLAKEGKLGLLMKAMIRTFGLKLPKTNMSKEEIKAAMTALIDTFESVRNRKQ